MNNYSSAFIIFDPYYLKNVARMIRPDRDHLVALCMQVEYAHDDRVVKSVANRRLVTAVLECRSLNPHRHDTTLY